MRGEMLATWMTLTKDPPSTSLHFSVPRRHEAVGEGANGRKGMGSQLKRSTT